MSVLGLGLKANVSDLGPDVNDLVNTRTRPHVHVVIKKVTTVIEVLLLPSFLYLQQASRSASA
jgi:hypothetical protein